MSHPLLHELANHQYLRLKLEEQFPNVDEETLLDTLEGMTNLHEMLAVVVRSQLDDRALAAALRARTRDMQERLARFEQRAEKKKEITTSVLERAGIKKLTEPDFTLSLRPTPSPLVVTDEKEIPSQFWNPQPAKLDRQGLIDALKANQEVPGALLGNARMAISVRTK